MCDIYKARFGAAVFSLLFIFLFAASAQSWKQSSAPYEYTGWLGLASSADGVKLTAVGNSGIFTSTNSGSSWNTNVIPDSPYSVACSTDGSRIVVGCNCGGIYTSTNSGQTWDSNSVPFGCWVSMAASADGMRLAGLSWYHNLFYTSTNAGVSWISNSPPDTNATYYGAIASSASGSLLVMARTIYPVSGSSHYGWIYTSTDFGATWRKTSAPQTNWCSIACSAGGSNLVAVANNDNPSGSMWSQDFVYISTNSGDSWLMRSMPFEMGASPIACSTNGNNLIFAPQNSNQILTSTNLGATWITNSLSANPGWNSVATSADGSKLTAGGTYVYTWQYRPVLGLTFSRSITTLFWADSTFANGYVLQQSDGLSSSNWTTVTQATSDDGTNTSLIMSLSSHGHFFRLFHP